MYHPNERPSCGNRRKVAKPGRFRPSGRKAGSPGAGAGGAQLPPPPSPRPPSPPPPRHSPAMLPGTTAGATDRPGPGRTCAGGAPEGREAGVEVGGGGGVGGSREGGAGRHGQQHAAGGALQAHGRGGPEGPPAPVHRLHLLRPARRRRGPTTWPPSSSCATTWPA